MGEVSEREYLETIGEFRARFAAQEAREQALAREVAGLRAQGATTNSRIAKAATVIVLVALVKVSPELGAVIASLV